MTDTYLLAGELMYFDAYEDILFPSSAYPMLGIFFFSNTEGQIRSAASQSYDIQSSCIT